MSGHRHCQFELVRPQGRGARGSVLVGEHDRHDGLGVVAGADVQHEGDDGCPAVAGCAVVVVRHDGQMAQQTSLGTWWSTVYLPYQADTTVATKRWGSKYPYAAKFEFEGTDHLTNWQSFCSQS